MIIIIIQLKFQQKGLFSKFFYVSWLIRKKLILMKTWFKLISIFAWPKDLREQILSTCDAFSPGYIERATIFNWIIRHVCDLFFCENTPPNTMLIIGILTFHSILNSLLCIVTVKSLAVWHDIPQNKSRWNSRERSKIATKSHW